VGIRCLSTHTNPFVQDKHFSTNQSEQNLILDSNISDLEDDGLSSKLKYNCDASSASNLNSLGLKEKQASLREPKKDHSGPLRKLTEIPEREDQADD